MTPYITTGGMELMLRALNGEELIFTHVAIGSGAPPANPRLATGLTALKMTLDISAASISDGYISLQCETTNAGVTNGFKVREYGIYAQDMDDSTQEVLYAYITETENQADYIPAAGVRTKEIKIAPTITVGTAENISAIVNASIEYVPRTEFQTHVNADNNPHGVTKAQVGLGNVQNVAVDNMAPTFTAASASNLNNLKLSSGSTLKTLFGKLKTFVETVIAHLTNHSNPHGVTCEQIDAAPLDHSHTSKGFTGTLPVPKGGTGRTEWDVGAVVIGNGNRLASVYGHGAMFCDGEVGPTFGTLPEEYGGTGLSGLNGGVLLSDGEHISESDGEGAFFHASGADAPEWGTLSVSLGGTGKTSFDTGSILAGFGNSIKEIKGDGAFFHTNGDSFPKYGTLPVAYGGTGKKTEAAYTQDVFDRIRTKSVPVIVQGSYIGNGSVTIPVKLEFTSAPKMIMVTREDTGSLSSAEDGAGFYALNGTTKMINVDLTWGSNYVSFLSNYTGSVSGTGAQLGMNSDGVTYRYIALL